jgi:hypothetical protein
VAYAAIADVQARVPTQVCQMGETSQPSADVVEGWLDATSAWVDASLRWKYLVPVTDAADRGTLKQVVAQLVAAQVWDVIGGHGGDQPAGGASLRRAAFQMLAYNEREGRSYLLLPGTTLADTGEAEVEQPVGSFSDPDDGAGSSRLFSIGMNF